MLKVRAAINTTNISTYMWSDSTITLNWISSPSRKWATFVANRVGEIQRSTRPGDWHHVSSAKNPADMLSRGVEPHDLITASMWWHGPDFLELSEEHWPSSDINQNNEDMPELRVIHTAVAVINHSIVDELLNRHSSLGKICRIIAYCLRVSKAEPKPSTVFVSHEEITSALHALCKTIQAGSFPEEYKALSSGRSISPTSKILSLSAFMDNHGLIRVGGRLNNSDLPFSACHQILLPRDHEITKRIITQEHVRNMHAGTQATMAAVRQQFWPLSLRSSTRKVIQKCVRCFRCKPSLSEAIMAPLPPGRVKISKPFTHCGVDYAGPVIIREGKRRNARNHKAYIAIFVCFVTKAAHIELVSDLTSDSFIAALKRFVSRKGKPSHMYSDNGTTFVGAQNQIKEFYEFIHDKQIQENVRQFLRDQDTSWFFIPPNAPHFGGLWEAAVKSAKHHMNRIIGRAHLTFEELSTVLCEIEAILNSRPITALSEDLNYLSPGHFLIGTTMNSLPCHDLKDVNENRLLRWQRIEQLRQHFWSRWSYEYLHSLQSRSKWKVNKGIQLGTNQLVLVKHQDLPPLCWSLGRVLEVHTGKDGVGRTATIKTAKGQLVRPLSKLAILPVEVAAEP